jgi:hypothetical protein
MPGQPDAFDAAMRITGGSYRPSTGATAAGFATSCRAPFLLPNILAPGRPWHKPSQVKRTGAGPPIASSASDHPAIQLTTARGEPRTYGSADHELPDPDNPPTPEQVDR